MEEKYTPAVIIGAGPAGLATAGRLRKMEIEFEVLEQTDKIAWSWHNHYDRLCLHTVKQFSFLPHKEFPADYPLYVPRADLVQYFEAYAKDFDIKPHFNTKVTAVKRRENEQWKVETSTGKSFLTDNVIVATGVNRVPHAPSWPGLDQYKGQLVHSRDYKNTEPFKGQKVLVIGFGNTGAEVALDLSENDIEVAVSIRSPITIVPRDVNGRPVQVTAKQLAKLPFGLGDWLGTQIRRFIIGDLTKYGVPLSKMHPAVQLRETGKTPVIDIGTVEHIKSGRIQVLGDVKEFYEDGVILEFGEKMAFDSVILATGYRPNLDEFIENVEPMLDRYQLPKQPIGDKGYEGLYFVGFDNYKLSGLHGTIFNDYETVAEKIKSKIKHLLTKV